ncbi:TPA: hypothetical protein DD445_02045 [Candidatus Nomurabacteria bacterium]|nr:hypothetical protein [Candidatus Nomurabacteria bacterium]HBP27553.1 hypothetical protein [Candidatus Nomurabacteria bacterium]HBR66190.1 hypothetical protein [Candidatus Nomurabacteria bacterium]HCU47233.1 hypothetical protein [Candidatus Nomurabacteria bacterium]
MNTKIKLLIVGTIALFGLFMATNPVSAMTCNSATISGTVVTGTPPTHARFAYNANYNTVLSGQGTTTPVQYFYTKGTFPIEQLISGLTESTTYYYRLEVTNNYGTVNLDIKNFTTPACPVSTYTVSANAGTGGIISPGSTTVNSGDTATFTAIPNSNYSVSSISSTCGGSRSGNSYTTNKIYFNCSVSASFTANQPTRYTVTPTAGTGGSIYPSYAVDVDYGNTTSFSITPSTGYSIASVNGTCGGSRSGNSYTTNKIYSNCSVDASFTKDIVISKPTVNLTAASTNLNYGGSTTLTWSTTNNPTSCVGTNFNTNNSTSGSVGTGALYSSKTYSITCSNSAGYTSDSLTVNVANQINPSGNLTVSPSSCIIASNQSTCTTSATWNTSDTTSASLIDGNTGNTLSSSLDQYYPFTVWVSYPYTTFNLKSGTTTLDTKRATASCVSGTSWSGTACITNQPTTYTVSANAGTGGYVSQSSITVNSGSTATFTVTAYSGYAISSVSGCNGTLNGNTYTTGPVYASCSVYASFTANQITQNPSVTLTAGSTNVTSGNSTYITWTPYNATSCVASGGSNGWVDYKSINGGSFSTGALYNTTTYSITCYNSSSTTPAYSSITIYVNNNNYNLPPVINLYASPSYVNSGSSSYINWNPTNNPTYCTASNGSNYWSGSRSLYSSNFSTGALYNTTTYTMTCGNSAGSTTESVTVTVGNQNIPLQTSVSLTADRTDISYGESTIVRWYPLNATSCYASGGSNNWAGTKSIYSNSFNTGALSYSTTYTISCTNSSGTSDTKSVTVVVGNQQTNNQPTVNISTDETSIPFNGTTFVRWYTTNATSCYASGGSSGWSGTKSIGPASFYTGSLTTNKTYTITCTNSFGSASDSTRVSVRSEIQDNQRPTPTSLVLITSSVDRNQPIIPTIDNTRPKPGDEINYTVNYQNIGTGSITNLTLRMDLPYEVDYMFSTPNNPTKSGNTLIFNLGTLKANGQGTITIRVKVRDNILAGTNLNFPATLSYTDPSGFSQSVNANVSAQIWNEPTIVTEKDNNISLGALAFLGGANFFPNTLLGWLLIILFIVLLILAIKKAYYTPEITTISKKTTTTHN